MSNHTYTKKISDDSIDLFLVFQIEQETVITHSSVIIIIHRKHNMCNNTIERETVITHSSVIIIIHRKHNMWIITLLKTSQASLKTFFDNVKPEQSQRSSVFIS